MISHKTDTCLLPKVAPSVYGGHITILNQCEGKNDGKPLFTRRLRDGFHIWDFYFTKILHAGQGCILPMGLEATFATDDVTTVFLAVKKKKTFTQRKERVHGGERYLEFSITLLMIVILSAC